jgi:2,4-dienoyl-CoA reductase (NADPH2)
MKLLEPVEFRNLKLKNRIAWTPAVSCLATEEGYVTDELIDRHVKRAKDGAGLIQVEACGVLDRKSPKLLRICTDDCISGHKKLTDAIHSYGAKCSVQLIHYVKQSVRTGWKQDVADLSYEDINEIVSQFVSAAVRAKDAGYDAVELHAAHGYTLASFISLLNKRTDQYGSGTAGRCKIVVDVIKDIREAVGPGYCVGARINGDEFVRGGSTIKQAVEVAEILGGTGLNFLSVSAGGKTEDGAWYTGYSGERTMPTSAYPWGCHLYLSDAIRKVLVSKNIPVIAAGRIQNLQHGEEVLAKGQADIIGYCRPMLCDPEWISKQLEGREKEIIKCAYCNICQDRDRVFEPVNCIVYEKYCEAKGIEPYKQIYHGE